MVVELRRQYDVTGRIVDTPEESFLNTFGSGNYRDSVKEINKRQKEGQEGYRNVPSGTSSLADDLVARQRDLTSHTAGFEAYMRARGNGTGMVFGVNDVVDKYGVAAGSYDPVPLPKIQGHRVACTKPGGPDIPGALDLDLYPLPPHLAWGEILVALRAVPISPADLYSVATGGTYGNDTRHAPFTAGHEGVAVVVKVGPGVDHVQEGDWVLPQVRRTTQ